MQFLIKPEPKISAKHKIDNKSKGDNYDINWFYALQKKTRKPE